MGVATDCSTVNASAPTYMVLIWISGGTISGNCETGNCTSATVPRMTNMIDMTMATIGRLIKNFATPVYLFSAWG